MDDFLQKVIDVLILPLEFLSNAADALNSYQFDESLLFNYLGYMHYAMGTPLYTVFSTVALIFIGASLWSFIVKAIAWFMDIVPFA